MNKLLELYEKRNKALAAARTFLDARREVSDTLTAEDSATYDRMEGEVTALTAEIERESKLSAIENELKKPTSAPITSNPQNAEKPKTGRASEEYRADFACVLRGKMPINNVLSTSPDADGGSVSRARARGNLMQRLQIFSNTEAHGKKHVRL